MALIVSAVGLHTAFAQKTAIVLTGDWTASFDLAKSDKIHLSFERRTDNGGRNRTGSDYDFADLQGLSREQAAADGPAKFSLVREAGRIDCEGEFRDGKGAGTFRFAGIRPSSRRCEAAASTSEVILRPRTAHALPKISCSRPRR